MADDGKMRRASVSGTLRSSSVPGDEPRTRRTSTGVLILAGAMGLALNHSTLLGGFNTSIADALLLLLLAALALAGRLAVPIAVPVFLCAVLGMTLTTAGFLTPLQFGVAPEPSRIGSDAMKLVVAGLFVVCGASLAGAGLVTRVLRWYAWAATAVAALGIVMQVSGATALRDLLFYGDLRFRGLMSDPNYWAVLTCAAVAFFVRDHSLRLVVRAPSIAVLAVAVVLSGSKTGVIVLLAYGTFVLVDQTLRLRRPVLATALLAGGVALSLFWGTLATAISQAMQEHAAALPQLARLSALIDDPAAAVGSDGSSRLGTWESGLEVIAASPLVGVGVGTYSSVNEVVTGSGSLAHNTFLQIAAEWGMPLALVFLVWLGVTLVRASSHARGAERLAERLMLRDMILTFLAGSLSLSLNNARMFWLFLGMLMVSIALESRSTGLTDGSARREGPAATSSAAAAD